MKKERIKKEYSGSFIGFSQYCDDIEQIESWSKGNIIRNIIVSIIVITLMIVVPAFIAFINL